MSLFVSLSEIEERFDARSNHEIEPRYNIAPGDGLDVIPNTDEDMIDRFQWGCGRPGATIPKTGAPNQRPGRDSRE